MAENQIHPGVNDNFLLPLAKSLFTNFQSPDFHGAEFSKLTENDKTFWITYAENIPAKFLQINLNIRPFTDYCRTCIITDHDIGNLVQTDLAFYFSGHSAEPLKSNIAKTGAKPRLPDFLESKSREEIKGFLTDLVFMIPRVLKLNGFELIRYEEVTEINNLLVRKLARAIHSKYLHEIKTRNTITADFLFFNPGAALKNNIPEFDDLPEEIKYSNFDNAAHIPTKLLSIGYKIRKVKKGFRPYALHLNPEEVETMAIVEHLRWSWEKRLNGWLPGSPRDDVNKIHPSLVPYDQLSESEKEKDRELVRLIPSFLLDINYEVFPLSPNRIKKLSYSIRPRSNINKILDETRKLNDQIRKQVALTPAIEEMISIRNNKIEEAIIEIEDSYNYAQHIQETFLPDDLYIRECFPDSFVLFKPKDVVSGDFYFFSRQQELVIFAAADCTGHGIPGALISTIGYGILDQAVNELKLTEPSDILQHLYSRVHRFLRENEEGADLRDDMDIVLCVFNINTNILKFSGVKNPLYHVTDGLVNVYRAKNFTDSGSRESPQAPDLIQLKAGDSIYLCSDGYTDQFGGTNHKKYRSTQFKTLLLQIQEFSMSEQSDMLNEEIELWREANDEDQTDDILVIGIRV
jgi:serine phosphatase RsbU (regulator of sigma subunit)